MCDDEESNRLNSTALRRIDPTFSKLHGTASQVAVYRYNSTTQSWDKTDTVGCLFLYERNVAPMYGLVVMNRKNANNFLQKFGPDGQVVLHQPYLLLRSVEDLQHDLRDGSQAIHCIWFYEPQDCIASANILKKMGLKFEGETGLSLQPQRVPLLENSGQQAGNILFQILQKGKKETPIPKEKLAVRVLTAEELESQMLHESTSLHSQQFPLSNGKTPLSYRQAAAAGVVSSKQHSRKSPKGSSHPNKRNPPQQPKRTVLDKFMNMTLQETTPSGILESQGTAEDAQSPASYPAVASHTICSQQNQMRTVEQLERDMKKSDTSVVAIQNELMQTLGIPNLTGPTERTDYENFPNTSPYQPPERCSMLDNIVGKSVDETDPEQLRQVLQNIEPSNLILVTENVPGRNETRLTWRLNRSSSLRKDSESAFTTPTGEFLSASGTRCSSQQGSFEGASCPRQTDRPSPLTKEQLLQSMMFLLQNDPEFVEKLHDGYVRSLRQAFDARPL